MTNHPAVRRLAAALLALALVAGPARGAEPSPQPETAQRLLGAGREAARRGSFGDAEMALRGALAACRAGGDERCKWTALVSLTAVAQALGRLDDARGFAQEAATTAHRIGDRAAQGESYHLLGLVLAEAGEPDHARAAASRALAVGRELERADLEARVLALLGQLELAAGNTEEACSLFEEALSRALATGLVPLTVRTRMGLGRCRLARGKTGEAEAAFEEAFAEAVGSGDKLSVARLLHETGHLARARNEPLRAERLFTDALRKYRAMGASTYAERAATDLEALRAEAPLPSATGRAERTDEAKRRGMEHLEAGNMEAAAKELKEAAKLSPYDPETRRALAQAYRAMGLQALSEQEDQYASALTENNAPFDLTSQDPRHLDYFAALRRQIDRVYLVPPEVLRGELSGTVRVTFTLERTGRLAEAAVETPAESPLLDEAALTTLRLAEPFEPFPDGVAQERVTITARFIYEQSLSEGPSSPEGESGR